MTRDEKGLRDLLDAARTRSRETAAAVVTGPAAARIVESLASAAGLELLRIDLRSVASKYIGETEKNLDAVFKDAEQKGAVLLLDEADALFGRRTGVKDSNDRYANIDVGYLLQRMESYQGLSILATNARSNIDDAFKRRIRYVLDLSGAAAVSARLRTEP